MFTSCLDPWIGNIDETAYGVPRPKPPRIECLDFEAPRLTSPIIDVGTYLLSPIWRHSSGQKASVAYEFEYDSVYVSEYESVYSLELVGYVSNLRVLRRLDHLRCGFA